MLDGWKEIAAELERLSGVERSRMTLWRYARRRRDPLPARKVMGRTMADLDDLASWWRRNQRTY